MHRFRLAFVPFLLFIATFHFASAQNQALDFDGVNDYVVTSLNSPSQYTLEAWVNMRTILPDQTIFRWTAAADPNQVSHWLKVDVSGTFFEHYVYDGAVKSVVGTTAINPSQWYHVAITATSGGQIRLFVDGIEEGTPAAVGALWAAGNQLRIGDRPSTFPFFEGQIDEFRFWNYQRNQSEIQSTMSNELIGNEAGLVAYYDFSEGTGTTAGDRTANLNNGSLINFALSGATSNWVDSGPVLGAGDVVPPVLSNISFENILDDRADVRFDLDEEASLYFVVTQSPTIPSDAQIKAGQDEFGTPVSVSGIVPVAPAGNQLYVIAGLSPSTNYYIYWIAEDAALNLSNVLQGNFTTTNSNPPAVPSDLIAYRISPTQIQLEWLDNALDETAYVIERATDYAFSSPVFIDAIGIDAGVYVDNISVNDGYFYRVGAQNGSGTSYSNVEFARTNDFSGYALSMDGVGDFATTFTGTSLNIIGNYTVEAWVKPTAFNAMVIFSTRTSTQDFGFDMQIANGNLIHADIGNGSSWLTTTADATYNYNLNEWMHIAYAVTNAGYTIYVNGAEQGSGTFGGTPILIDSNRPFMTIGAGNENGGVEYSGEIDEVKIWNFAKTGFSDRLSPLNGNEGGLMAYYSFDENTGPFSTAVDRSINTFDATLQGDATYVPSTIINAAPQIFNFGVIDVTSTSATVSVNVDISSVLYYVVTQSGIEPSNSQIQNGQDDLGNPAIFSGNIGLPPGFSNFGLSGLDPATNYFVYAVAETGGQFSNTVSDNFTTLGNPIITVLTPNGGENVEQNSLYEITWNTIDVVNDPLLVIEYSTDGGTSWIPIHTDYMSYLNGKYGWYVDAGLFPIAGNYLIQVRTDDGSTVDQSDAPFSISAPGAASLAMVYPNGGEQFERGQSIQINYTFTGLAGSEELFFDYSADGGSNWTSIGSTQISSSPGIYYFYLDPLSVPISANYLIRVRNSNSTLVDQSDAPFTVISEPPPTIDIYNPSPGQQVEQNSITPIFIGFTNFFDGTTVIVLEVSSNNGSSWTEIVQRPLETLYNGFNWLVSTASYSTGTNYLIRARTTDSSVIGTTPGTFEVVSPFSAPSVFIQNPSGPSTYYRGNTQPIQFLTTAIPPTNQIEISWSTDGVSYTQMAQDALSNIPGEYTWVIDATYPESNNFTILIRDLGGTGASDTTDVLSIVVPPKVTIESQNVTGGNLVQGSANNLIYKFSALIEDKDAITEGVFLLFNGDITPAEVDALNISFNTVDDFATASLLTVGEYPNVSIPDLEGNGALWLFSEPLTQGSTYFFYVSLDVSGSASVGTSFNISTPTEENFGFGESSNVIVNALAGNAFTIQAATPAITVTQPNGGEILNVGDNYPISWTNSGFPGSDAIEIQLSTNGGSTFNNIATGTFDNYNGTFNWVVPNLVGATNLIRVRNITTTVSDQSDASFTIQLPTVPAPSIQASNISFISTGIANTDLTWSNGNGAERIVFMRQGNAAFPVPVNNQTYTPSTVFGSGAGLGNGWFAVYAGTGSSVSVTGLQPATTYVAAVLEYNFDGLGQVTYLTTGAAQNPNSTQTLPLPNVSLHFDGVNDYVEIPYDPILDLGNTYSIEAYVKSGDSTSGFRSIIDKRNAGTNNSNFSLSVANGTDLGIYMNNGTTNFFQTVPGVLQVGTWALLGVTYDGSNVRVYVNGIERAVFPVTMTYVNQSVPIQIGRAAFNDEFFNGEIDEVRIWTNVLTPANIGANATRGLIGNEFGLVAYYNFNDGIPGANNSAVISVNNSASVSASKPMDGVLNGFAKTGATSNFVESTAFDFLVTRPNGQANLINISGITTTSANIAWANGNGVKRIVAMRLTSADDLPDLSDNTYYRADVGYGKGDQTPDGWYIIYNGVGNAVTVTGLSPSANYKVAVIEANGPAGAELYLLNTNIGNPNTFTTLAITPNVVVSTIPVAGLNIRQGKSNVLVYKFKMEVKDAPVDMASLSLNFGGNALDTDFAGLGGLKLFASVTGDNITNFNTSVPIASSSYNSGAPFWFVSRNYPKGTVVHFYVTASTDIAAVPGRTFNPSTPIAGNFSFSSSPAPIINLAAAGSGNTFSVEQTPSVTLTSEIDPTVMRKRITPGSTDNWVYKYNVVIDRDVRVTKVRIPFDGTLLAADVPANGAKLWVNTNSGITTPPTGNPLATASVGISEIVFNIPSGSQLFTGPNTIQFWISLDVATNARLANTFQGAGTINDFTFNDIVFRFNNPTIGQKATITPADAYCDPTVIPVSTTVGPTITNFTMPGINNNPQGEQDYHMFYLSNSSGVLSNTTQNVSVTSSGNGFVKMWVDWDKNNAFNESTELVINNVAVTAGVPLNTTINVPATATAGNSRIRVYVYQTNEWINGGCNPLNGGITTAEGQIHDYGISIVEPNSATQTLAASNVGYFNFTANWVAMPGANFYRIDVAEDPGFTKLLVQNAGVTTNSFTISTNLKYDKSYYYRVRVAYPATLSGNSNVTAVRTARDPLTAQDSAALVLMHQLNGGNSWKNATNWRQSGKRLETWAGVTMTGTRVTGLNMQGFGLTGDLPDEFNNAAALQLLTTWNLSMNKLTGIAVTETLGALVNINVIDNQLVFEDLAPLVGLFTTFDYAPQKDVGTPSEVIIPRGSNYTVSFIEQPAESYQWKRNDNLIPGATSTSYLIEDIKFETMGDFTLDMTDSSVPGLTLKSAPQTVLASGGITLNVADLNGLPLEQGTGYLMKIEQPGQPFDTTMVVDFADGYLFFDVTILGDYIISVISNPDIFLPTYYKGTFLWEEADTLFFRNVALFADMTMTSIPGALNPVDKGRISGYMDIDVPDVPGARIEGRRRASNVRCHIRRNTTRGRTEEDTYVLIASVVTDENGEFSIPNLPPGFYRINFEYPGVPMDRNSFVEFEVTADGDNSAIELAALAINGLCTVEQILPTSIGSFVEELRIYPNPVSQLLHLNYSYLVDDATVSILNINGQEVSKTTMRRSDFGLHTIDVSSLSGGIYLLNVMDSKSGKLISSYKVLVRK